MGWRSWYATERCCGCALLRLCCCCRRVTCASWSRVCVYPNHRNQFQCDVNQTLMESIYDALVDRSRTVDGVPTSLWDLGYRGAGLDDCWQLCE